MVKFGPWQYISDDEYNDWKSLSPFTSTITTTTNYMSSTTHNNDILLATNTITCTTCTTDSDGEPPPKRCKPVAIIDDKDRKLAVYQSVADAAKAIKPEEPQSWASLSSGISQVCNGRGRKTAAKRKWQWISTQEYHKYKNSSNE